jgi:hypothetical protein
MSTPKHDSDVGHEGQAKVHSETYSEQQETLANPQKNTWKKLMPVIACGAGLFSDGYLNNVCYLGSRCTSKILIEMFR